MDRERVKWLMAITDIGNRAAHNYEVSTDEVGELLEGVGAVLQARK